MAMFGILNFDKPPGWTSRDVVNRVQRLVRPAKAGHAGTLDPLATGVLVVCVGPATRLVEYVQQMPKRYRATFRLGCTSPSDDTELEVTHLDAPPVPTRDVIEHALPMFVGDIQQRPPAYSAIKIEGKKAYQRARAGEKVEPASRQVTIHEIQILDYTYPELTLDIHCGSGTYVRSLGRDLAESLGTGAVMTALVRTSIGEFQVTESISPKDLTLEQIDRHLQPALLAVAPLPRITLTPAEAIEIGHGRFITARPPRSDECAAELSCGTTPPEETAALDPTGKLFALLHPRGEGRWGPRIVFRNSN